MLKTNYHTHSEYCDGQGSLVEVVESALERQFDILGFSSHGPVPFETDWTMPSDRLEEYLGEIDGLKREYQGKIEILKGLELDFIPGVTAPFKETMSRLRLDFSVGSVHYLPAQGLPLLTVDGPQQEVDQLFSKGFDGDNRAFVGAYYSNLREMVRQGGVNIVGHFDLIKKRNSQGNYFNEGDRWYRVMVEETIEDLSRNNRDDLVIEVNTGGISRGAVNTVYPAPELLPLFREAGLAVTICSDSHHPDHLDFFFPQAAKMIQEAGYKSIRILSKGKWQDQPLEEYLV